MNNYNQLPDELLDRALNDLGIEPLPSDFVNQVMVRVLLANVGSERRQTTTITPPRFRLQFLDIVLSLFWSLMLITIWATTLWWTGLLDLDWLPPAQTAVSVVEQLSMASPGHLLAGITLVLLEMSILGLLGVNLFGERMSGI